MKIHICQTADRNMSMNFQKLNRAVLGSFLLLHTVPCGELSSTKRPPVCSVRGLGMNRFKGGCVIGPASAGFFSTFYDHSSKRKNKHRRSVLE